MMWFLRYSLLHLVIYTVLRVLFLVWYWPEFSQQTIGTLGLAFVHGLRFDLAALAGTLAISYIVLLWTAKQPIIQRMVLGLFLILQLGWLTINLIDIELFQFTAKRLTVSSFYLADQVNVTQLIAPHLVLIAVSAVVLGGYSAGYYYLIRHLPNPLSLTKK